MFMLLHKTKSNCDTLYEYIAKTNTNLNTRYNENISLK